MWNNQKQLKVFSFMSNLQTYYHFKLDLKKVDQHTGRKWLIHGTKRRKDNQLQKNKVSHKKRCHTRFHAKCNITSPLIPEICMYRLTAVEIDCPERNLVSEA